MIMRQQEFGGGIIYIHQDQKKKYFDKWRSFLINKIIQNKIEVIYTIKPLEGEENILQNIISNQCYNEKNLSKILMFQEIITCKELESSIITE